MRVRLIPIGLGLWLTACAQSQMGYNVLSYDAAIAETSNQSLLLNAVRASQRYPVSFTSVGQLVANPSVSGSLSKTFDFSALISGGLTTYSLNPTVSGNAGYTSFALDNLNFRDFMETIRKPIPQIITNSFRSSPTWPRELLAVC
jgi:hypothetical protein